MKRLSLFFIVCLVVLCCVVKAQNCPFHVRFTTEVGTCFNNAAVHFALYDDGNHPIPMDQVTTLYPDLSHGRGYYQRNSEDHKHYTADWATEMYLEPGTYIVGYEAVCSDGHGGSILLSHDSTLVLTTTYVIPTASAIGRTSTDLEDFGRWPTLDCGNTGRIQLKIENGRFPYHVVMINHDSGDTARVVNFDNYMYWNSLAGDFINASDATRFDYKDYYSFENMPAGNFDFYIEDGCGYGLPRTGQIVQQISFPELLNITPLPSEGETSNVVQFKLTLNKKYPYYNLMLPTGAEYRLSYPGLTGNGWKPFPYTPTESIVVSDTLSDMAGYCDLWEKITTCEYKIKDGVCGPEKIVTKTTSISKPSPSNFKTDEYWTIDSLCENAMDPCATEYYMHNSSYTIVYDLGDGSSNTDIRTFTKPISWVYTDLSTSTVIKRDTIPTIGTTSALTDADIWDVYGPFNVTPLDLNVKRALVDKNGCEMYSRTDNMTFEHEISPVLADWKMTHSIDNDHCNQTMRWIKLEENHASPVDADGTIIRLTQSPNNNFYNFEAVFHHATYSWTVTYANQYNTAMVFGDINGRWLQMQDYGLQTGPYVFEVITPCQTFTMDAKYQYPDVYSVELTVPESYEFYQECTDMYITPLAGEFNFVKRNNDLNTGLPLPPTSTLLPSAFSVINGPVGGYDNSNVQIGQPTRISMPGEYVLRFEVAGGTESYCNSVTVVYDTIHYSGGTMEYELASALLCDRSSDHGDVYVQADHGTAPIKYVLRAGPNLTGDTLGIITVTDANGIATFSNMPFLSSQTLSCYVEDACHGFFSINIEPTLWNETQLTWFDGGVDVMTTCEGTLLQLHALSVKDYFTYDWTGPNGYHATVSDPEIFIPRANGNGFYYVTINNSGCAVPPRDSVYLTVIGAPSLTIGTDALICPGTEAPITLTPHSTNTAGDINFRIAVSDAGTNNVTYYDLTSAEGATLTKNLQLNVESYVYAVSVDDGTCEYTHPEDSVHITMRTDVANSCVISTQDDKVCYGTAAQMKAKSTIGAPYTLKWYGDYELTHLLKEEDITTDAAWSTYDTADLVQSAYLYVSVEKSGSCPTANGLVTSNLNMNGGPLTVLGCGDLVHFFDDGGVTGDYSHTPRDQRFASSNGSPVCIRFNYLDIADNAKLYVVSGSTYKPDSILYTLTCTSPLPSIIFSNSDTLSLFFAPGGKAPQRGWDAFVEQKPGMAMADVFPENKNTFHDAVCQNQAGVYDDPYGAKTWSTTIANKIKNDVKKTGTYTYVYTHSNMDVNGCDSTTTLVLSVEPPFQNDTSVTTINFAGPYTWHGHTYSTTGVYTDVHTDVNGCDSLDVLYLTVLQVDTFTNKICPGDSIEVFVHATVPLMENAPDLVPQAVNVGDVLCDDGSFVRPSEFTNKTTFEALGKIPKGVVFYVDETGQHGWALSLNYVPTSACEQRYWAKSEYRSYIHSLTSTQDIWVACSDLAGYDNTLQIKLTAESVGTHDFETNAPAAYRSYFFNHITGDVGTTPLGWYLPAYGQLRLLYGVRFMVNATLRKLGRQLLSDSWIISSTEMGNNDRWSQHPSGGNGLSGKTDCQFATIRPCIDF